MKMITKLYSHVSKPLVGGLLGMAFIAAYAPESAADSVSDPLSAGDRVAQASATTPPITASSTCPGNIARNPSFENVSPTSEHASFPLAWSDSENGSGAVPFPDETQATDGVRSFTVDTTDIIPPANGNYSYAMVQFVGFVDGGSKLAVSLDLSYDNVVSDDIPVRVQFLESFPNGFNIAPQLFATVPTDGHIQLGELTHELDPRTESLLLLITVPEASVVNMDNVCIRPVD